MAETQVFMGQLQKYCMGCGIDIGAGGFKVTPSAISIDLPEPYVQVGSEPNQLKGDARNFYWFTDECLDYVYSSHLLEDFEDTNSVLKEWLRTLKPQGYLVLVLPDQERYEQHTDNEKINKAHKVEMSFDYIMEIFEQLKSENICTKLIESDCEFQISPYSFYVVLQKEESPCP